MDPKQRESTIVGRIIYHGDAFKEGFHFVIWRREISVFFKFLGGPRFHEKNNLDQARLISYLPWVDSRIRIWRWIFWRTCATKNNSFSLVVITYGWSNSILKWTGSHKCGL